ncbi:MAG TPA: hypothetical protein VI168_06280 [Croceibacterium sp.]
MPILAAARVKLRSSATATIAELDAAVAAIEVRGARLPDGVLAFSGVEAAPKN